MAAPERPSHAKHLLTRVQHLWAMSYHFGGIQRVRGEPLHSLVKLVLHVTSNCRTVPAGATALLAGKQRRKLTLTLCERKTE